MVGFNINLKIQKESISNSESSKNLQISNKSKSMKYRCKSDLNGFRTIKISSISSSLNRKSYECLMCQKMFNQRQTYQNHLRTHVKGSKDPYCCNICKKSFTVPARLTRHYRTHTGEKPYQCEYCSKSFSVKENLSVHRRIHTKERPYKCDVCESAFEHSGKLHRHMRIHTGERPHKCSVCNKTFIQSGQLVIHMRTHTGEKPYVCKSCGKGFTCSKQLKVHTRTHTGEKPYTCDICGKSFGYNHVLKLHQVAHYGEKCYKCTLCQETFNSKKLMDSHIKKHSDSSINNLCKKTKSIFESTKDTHRMLICDYINNCKVPINETKITKCTKIKSPCESLNHSHCKPITLQIHKQPIQSDNLSLPASITDQRYLFLKANALTAKCPQSVSTEEKITQDITVKNQLLNNKCIFDDCSSKNSCLYETENNDFFSKERLQTICLSSSNLRQSIKTNFGKFEEKHQVISRDITACEGFTVAYNNKFGGPLYTSSLDLVIPNIKDNYSLPPRKRCKMILESMKSENSNLQATIQYPSVIRFAKAENISSDQNTPLFGTS